MHLPRGWYVVGIASGKVSGEGPLPRAEAIARADDLNGELGFRYWTAVELMVELVAAA